MPRLNEPNQSIDRLVRPPETDLTERVKALESQVSELTTQMAALGLLLTIPVAMDPISPADWKVCNEDGCCRNTPYHTG